MDSIDVSRGDVLKWIHETIVGADVVLFMKGHRDMPQCGFSSYVVQVLERCKVDYTDVNVLSNDDIRAAIKEYSEWPTLPQLYVKGSFVGGCDIVKEMYQSGELQQLFTEKGVKQTQRSM